MSSRTVTIIEASPKTLGARLYALWQFRGFYPFLFREIAGKKFRNTLLGYWWLIIRPLLTSAVVVVTFTFIVPTQIHGMPYVLFYFSGFIAWNLFHATVVYLPRTMRWMQGIMRRTYFPRILVPLAGFGVPLAETAFMAGLFVLSLVYFQVTAGVMYLKLSWALLWFLPCLLAALVLGLAIGMAASVVALYARDVIYSMSYFAQILMLLTPVLYPVAFIPPEYRWILYVLNPMAEIVEVSRYSLTGTGDFSPAFLALSLTMIAAIFALSVVFVFRAERFLGDEL